MAKARKTKTPSSSSGKAPGNAPRPVTPGGVLADRAPYAPCAAPRDSARPKGQQVLDRVLLPLGLFAVLLGTYIYMLCPQVAAGDSGELAAAALTLGIPHPPGYPLFCMLGKLFSFIPLNSLAWRVNLLSAVLDAGAAVLVYFILLSVTWRALPALAGSLFLGFSLVFWRYSLVAEVFPLNNFLFAALVLILVLWSRQVSTADTGSSAPAAARPFPAGLLYLWCLVLGLGLSNHHTLLFAVPAFLLFIWQVKPQAFRPQILIPGIVIFLLGLLPYIYLPLASSAQPYLNWDNPSQFGGLVKLVTRADYGSLTLSPTDISKPAAIMQLPVYIASLWEEFTLAGFLLGLIGMVRLRRKEPRLFTFLLTAFLLTSVVFLLIGNLDINKPSFYAVISRFHLMPGIVFALFIGFGAEALAAALAATLPRFSLALKFGVLALALLPLVLNASAASQRGNYQPYYYGMNALRSLPPNAVLLATGDTFLASLDYLHGAERQRPDIRIIEEKVKFPWYVQQLKRRYPDMVIPFEAVDMKSHFVRELVDANFAKFRFFVHQSSDPTIAQNYELVPYGLVSELLPKNTAPAPGAYQASLNQLLSQYQFDSARLARVHKFDFEGELRDNYAMMYDGIATLFAKLNDFTAPEGYWLKAIAINPDYAPPYRNLGILYAYKSGAPDAAAKAAGYWRKYLQLNPAAPDRAQIEAEMAKLGK